MPLSDKKKVAIGLISCFIAMCLGVVGAGLALLNPDHIVLVICVFGCLAVAAFILGFFIIYSDDAPQTLSLQLTKQELKEREIETRERERESREQERHRRQQELDAKQVAKEKERQDRKRIKKRLEGNFKKFIVEGGYAGLVIVEFEEIQKLIPDEDQALLREEYDAMLNEIRKPKSGRSL